jgi:hypothetical protein
MMCMNASGTARPSDSTRDSLISGPTGVDLAIHTDFAPLNGDLGLPSRIDPALDFQELFEGQLGKRWGIGVVGHSCSCIERVLSAREAESSVICGRHSAKNRQERLFH